MPLVNNVINLHFPPTPKLFVHRCGRAARQGRVGYAFSLVDIDEMPYMLDVHLLLGKPVSNDCSSLPGSHDDNRIEVLAGTGLDNVAENSSVRLMRHSTGYTLGTMKPGMIHTGLFPQTLLE